VWSQEKLDLEEAAEAAVEQMARANEFAEQVRSRRTNV
jgi:hypothetical protein